MRLIDFVELFDTAWEDIDVVIMTDPYTTDEKFAEKKYEYEECYRGKLSEIPMIFGKDYMAHYESYIDFDEKLLYIYTSARPPKGDRIWQQ